MTAILRRVRRPSLSPPVHAAGARLGLSAGQTDSFVTGIAVAVVLALFGLPPVFRDVVPVLAAPAQSSVSQGAAPSSASGDGTQPPTGTESTPSPVSTSGSPVAGPPPPSSSTTLPPAPESFPTPVVVTSGLHATADAGGLGGVVVADDGTVYTVTDNAPVRGSTGPSQILAFAPDGTPAGSWTVTGQPAVRTRGLVGVEVDIDGTVLVTDASTSRVLRLDPSTDTITTVATIADLRSCVLGLVKAPCEPGVVSLPPEIGGITRADDGTFFIADRTQGVVWRLDGSEVSLFVALDDRLPGEGPVDVALLRSDSLIIASSGRLLALPPGVPALFRVSTGPGGPGTPVAVHDFGIGETPAAIDIGRSERTYVSVPSAGVVFDIGLDFGDVVRITAGDVSPGFSQPTGVHVTDGGLLVANRQPSGATWPIHRLANPDKPRKERSGS